MNPSTTSPHPDQITTHLSKLLTGARHPPLSYTFRISKSGCPLFGITELLRSSMALLHQTTMDNVRAEWSQGAPVCDERKTPFIANITILNPSAATLVEFTMVNDADESYAVMVTDAVDDVPDQMLDFTTMPTRNHAIFHY
jgi:hypothetical protein